jgi:hypothetical protein
MCPNRILWLSCGQHRLENEVITAVFVLFDLLSLFRVLRLEMLLDMYDTKTLEAMRVVR